MKQNSKQALTPKLRFPEFRSRAAWSNCAGEQLFESVVKRADAAAGLPILAITQEHGAIPRDQIDYHVSVSDKSLESYKEVEVGDFIISLRSFQGGIEYSQYHGICSPAYVVLRRKGEGYDPFYKQLFKSRRFIQQLTATIEGLRDGKMISYKQFSEQSISTPSPDEQQKIAECLSSLDEVIAAQARKVEALKAHKNGLMQQLFPRADETVPRLRFTEFRNGPHWEVEPLDALYDFKPTNSLSREQLNYDTGDARNIHYGDIHTQFAATFRIGSERVPFVNPEYPLKAVRPDAYCQVGDIIFADASENLKDVGKCIEIVDLGGEKILAGSHTILARQKNKDLVLGFGAHLFKSQSIRTQIEKVAQGTKVMGISPGRLAKIKLAFPRSESEQIRITRCLTALDDTIADHAAKLDALRTHKVGLMQQLFPSPEESEA